MGTHGGLAALASDLDEMLVRLSGRAERLGALGVPVAQVYTAAAEASIAHAARAIRHFLDCERAAPTRTFAPAALDPRLLEWLD